MQIINILQNVLYVRDTGRDKCEKSKTKFRSFDKPVFLLLPFLSVPCFCVLLPTSSSAKPSLIFILYLMDQVCNVFHLPAHFIESNETGLFSSIKKSVILNVLLFTLCMLAPMIICCLRQTVVPMEMASQPFATVTAATCVQRLPYFTYPNVYERIVNVQFSALLTRLFVK